MYIYIYKYMNYKFKKYIIEHLKNIKIWIALLEKKYSCISIERY